MAWLFSSEYKERDQGSYYAPKIKTIPRELERFESLGRSLAQALFARAEAEELGMGSPDYPWWDVGEFPCLMSGWRWQMPDEPFRISLARDEGPLVDIINGGFGAWAISQRVIDMIEALEPKVHQYLPLELLQPDGSVHPDRRWLLNICSRADVVDVERSNTQWMAPPMSHKFMDAPGERRLVVRCEEASRRALWSEWRYHGAQREFASDALWTLLREAGVRGWQPHFAYPHHIEEV